MIIKILVLSSIILNLVLFFLLNKKKLKNIYIKII